MRRAVHILVLIAIVAAVTVSPAEARPPYSEPPPDFAHPDRPHTRSPVRCAENPSACLFSPHGGRATRRLLVIAPQFSDVPNDPSFDTPNEINSRFFDPGAGVRGYLAWASGGAFDLVPAAETVGRNNDGVVAVNAGAVASFLGVACGLNDCSGLEAANALSLADAVVDFSVFDADGDGTVRPEELLVVSFRTSRPGDTGGATRGIGVRGWPAAFDSIDGKRIGFSVTVSGTATNLITLAHETLHQAVDLEDFYGLGVGSLDVAGPTVRTSAISGFDGIDNDGDGLVDETDEALDGVDNDGDGLVDEADEARGRLETFFLPNSYNALHWGWGSPTVVVQDGYYDVPLYRNADDVFLLYDPGQGTDDYFLVENRWVGQRFDTGIQDSGLVIWRAADDRLRPPPFFTKVSDADRAIELMAPDGLRRQGCGDDDVDGLANEDPPGGIPIVGGGIDIDRDGVVTTADDGTYQGLTVTNGFFDFDGDGTPTPADTTNTGLLGGVRIIAGFIDVNNDGRITAADTGDPWQGVDNDGDNPGLSGDGLDNDRDGAVDEGDEGIDEDPIALGCYVGRPDDAWDPADPRTPQRTMSGRWLPAPPSTVGAPALVAVRAIWPRDSGGTAIRAYFDVRGPGILVDTFPLVSGGPLEVQPGELLEIEVPVRNTRDPSVGSTLFEFRIDDLPPGWSASAAAARLVAQTDRTTRLSLTAPADALNGETHTLQVVGVDATDPSVTSSAPLPVVVVARPGRPDALENNNSPGTGSRIELDEHSHIDTRVLGDGFSPRESTERWRATVNNLNLHNATDADFFTFPLPDRAIPPDGHSEFGGLPACGDFTREGLLGTERVLITSTLTVRIPSPPRSAEGEELRVESPVASTGDPFAKRIPCPETLGLDEFQFSFGERADSRENFPRYSVQAVYEIQVSRWPEEADWLFAERERRGSGAVLPIPCDGGGFFPECEPTEGLFTEMRLTHPAGPGRDCKADGCPDFFPFFWDGTGSFDLTFSSTLGIGSVHLLDVTGEVIASAAPHEPLPVEPFSASLTQAEGPQVVQGLQADLPEGQYVLVISGSEVDYALAFEPPPGPLSATLQPDPDQLDEPGGTVTFNVALTNNTPESVLEVTDLTVGGEPLDGRGTCNLVEIPPLNPRDTFSCQFDQEVSENAGDSHVETLQVLAEDDAGEPVESTALARITVADVLPSASLNTDAAPTSIPEPGGRATVAVKLVNESQLEAVTVDTLVVEIWTDSNGNGSPDPGEGKVFQIPGLADPPFEGTDCTTGHEIPAEGSYGCTIEFGLKGNPWADPVVAITATVSDDDDNEVRVDSVLTIDIEHRFGRGVDLRDEDLNVLALPSFATVHSPAGLVTEETPDPSLKVTLRVVNDTDDVLRDVLIREVGLQLERRTGSQGWQLVPAACVAGQDLPAVLSDELTLRFVCPTLKDVEGATLRVTAQLAIDGREKLFSVSTTVKP